MNMMEFVKLFKRIDTLETNQGYLYNIFKSVVKNEKKLSRLMFWVGIDLMLVWIYNAMSEKELNDLKKRVAELEMKEAYKNCGSDLDDIYKDDFTEE